MKKLYPVLTVILMVSLAFFSQSISAQCNPSWQWTFMKGSKTTDNLGTYGAPGVFAAGNKPGGRTYSGSWTDASGNFWMFGGYGQDDGTTGSADDLNDLWEYSPSLNQWASMKGKTVAATLGVYGTQGVAAATNNPGGRQNSSTWIDAAGNLWLFGGYGYDDGTYGFSDDLNDLWKYNRSTNQWTWMKGSKVAAQSGTYGTKGTAAAANTPGGRQGAVSWIDASGNLWLFGGIGYDNTGLWDDLNDLWKYNPATNQWTWMKGAKTASASGTYGTMGTAAAANTPGARQNPVAWNDGAGNLWLFAGYGYDHSGLFDYMNDVWKYTVSTNNWTWVNGSNAGGPSGVYGTQGTAAAGNHPGGRMEIIPWVDAFGKFWTFGGEGYDGTGFNEDLNDLWKYDPAINQWTWVKGSTTAAQTGSYGTMGVQAAGNHPGGRDAINASWMDLAGNLWLFGGDGYDATTIEGDLGDLWKLSPVILPVTLTGIKAYQKNTGINVEWTFTQEIDMDHYEVEKSTTGANFNHGGTVLSSGNHSSAITYSWFDTNPNRGANFYRVKMFDKNGQITYSQIVKVVIGIGTSISIYPNPVTNGSLSLQFNDQPKGSYDIRVLNSVGQIVFKTMINHNGGSATQTMQLPLSLSMGMYNLEVISPDGTINVERMIVGQNR